jgi:hypothetical protein
MRARKGKGRDSTVTHLGLWKSPSRMKRQATPDLGVNKARFVIRIFQISDDPQPKLRKFYFV